MCAAGGQSERGVQGPWLPALRPGGEGTWAKQGPLPSCPEKEAGKELWGASLQVCVCLWTSPAGRGQAASCLQGQSEELPALSSLCDAYPRA